jgi:hypothetical protein
MARRRMIDPNFWGSEHNMTLNFRQRLLFVGLISNADDDGRLRGNINYLRSTIFTYDDVQSDTIASDLQQLQDEGMIIWYNRENDKGREAKYIQLVNWSKYQRIDKPRESSYPPPLDQNGSKNESENDSKNGSALINEERKERSKKTKEGGNQESFSEPVLEKTTEEKRPASFQYASLCDDHPFIAEIASMGGSKAIRVPRLMKLFNEFGIDNIKRGYSVVKESIEQGKCKNPPAMFECAVKGKYTIHPSSRAAEILSKL